jgi:hypothetical protein
MLAFSLSGDKWRAGQSLGTEWHNAVAKGKELFSKVWERVSRMRGFNGVHLRQPFRAACLYMSASISKVRASISARWSNSDSYMHKLTSDAEHEPLHFVLEIRPEQPDRYVGIDIDHLIASLAKQSR